MNTYLRCLRYLKPYLRIVILALICMIFYAAFSTSIVMAVKPLVRSCVRPGLAELHVPLIDIRINFKPLHLLGVIALLMITFSVLKGFCYFGQSYLTTNAGSRAIMDMRNELFAHIHSQSLAFFSKEKTGRLISRITNDVGEVKDSLTVIFSDVIREPLTVIFMAAYLIRLDWQLALISLVAFPLSIYPLYRFGKKIRRVSYDRQKRRANLFALIQETIHGAETIKAFGTEDKEATRFDTAQKHAFRLSMKRARAVALSPAIAEFIGSLGLALLFYLGGRKIIGGDLTIPEFFSFIVALSALYQPVKKITQVNNKIQTSLAGATRVFELMDSLAHIQDVEGAKILPPFQREVRFDNVSFSYGEEKILRNLDLRVEKGEVIAIVGPSGVGKTTLVNLIPRFYEPGEGEITIDGEDIQKVTLKSLRAQIGIVTQETFLFNDTVETNIAYGTETNLSEGKIIEAAKAAHAHEFITKFSRGYQTIVGERGSQLSGGQRQRIAIARALLKNPPILILDEATSELDVEAEKIVQDALEKLMKHRTTFVIAHRLSTVVNADRIVVLDRGRIVETGVHQELIQKGGIYNKLYQMQFK